MLVSENLLRRMLACQDDWGAINSMVAWKEDEMKLNINTFYYKWFMGSTKSTKMYILDMLGPHLDNVYKAIRNPKKYRLRAKIDIYSSCSLSFIII